MSKKEQGFSTKELLLTFVLILFMILGAMKVGELTSGFISSTLSKSKQSIQNVTVSDFDFIQHFTTSYINEEPTISLLNARKTGEAQKEDGTIVNRFYITGVSRDETGWHRIEPREEWIGLGMFRTKMSPIDKEGRKAQFACDSDSKVIEGKIIYTIGEKTDKPLYVIENESGFVDIAGYYCTEVTNFKQIN